jgi:hypothetical protein
MTVRKLEDESGLGIIAAVKRCDCGNQRDVRRGRACEFSLSRKRPGRCCEYPFLGGEFNVGAHAHREDAAETRRGQLAIGERKVMLLQAVGGADWSRSREHWQSQWHPSGIKQVSPLPVAAQRLPRLRTGILAARARLAPSPSRGGNKKSVKESNSAHPSRVRPCWRGELRKD